MHVGSDLLFILVFTLIINTLVYCHTLLLLDDSDTILNIDNTNMLQLKMVNISFIDFHNENICKSHC